MIVISGQTRFSDSLPLRPSENPYFLRSVSIFSIKNARYISLEINI